MSRRIKSIDAALILNLRASGCRKQQVRKAIYIINGRAVCAVDIRTLTVLTDKQALDKRLNIKTVAKAVGT